MALFVEHQKTDARVVKTREALETAFRELIKEFHYSEIRVQQITERAGVNRATFYSHYEDKSHLAATVLRLGFDEKLSLCDSGESVLCEDYLEKVALATFTFFEETVGACPKSAQDFWSQLGLVLEDSLEQFVLLKLRRCRPATRSFGGVPDEAVAMMISWSICGAAFTWVKCPQRSSAEHSAKVIVRALFSGREKF